MLHPWNVCTHFKSSIQEENMSGDSEVKISWEICSAIQTQIRKTYKDFAEWTESHMYVVILSFPENPETKKGIKSFIFFIAVMRRT